MRGLAKGLLGRVLGYGALLLGFWLLFKGIIIPNYVLAALGGAAILAGMYGLVISRQVNLTSPAVRDTDNKEESPGDTLDGGDQGNKFPP